MLRHFNAELKIKKKKRLPKTFCSKFQIIVLFSQFIKFCFPCVLNNIAMNSNLQEKSPEDVERTFKKLYDRYVNDKSVEKSSSGSSESSGQISRILWFYCIFSNEKIVSKKTQSLIKKFFVS